MESKDKKVSVVCPYYNEEAIIEKATLGMLNNLKLLKLDWELVLVNDGSTDNSLSVVKKLTADNPKVKLVSYNTNKGRGHALKTGIINAEGDYIITTEVDLSWGDDIVQKIIDKFLSEPKLDVVVASPNIPGGGYKNVPIKRIILTKLGNLIIRLCFTTEITMNTGMTRGYRREIIKTLPTFEQGKEFHLEVLLKLRALAYKLGEVPAVLEWKDAKLAKPGSAKRKSSSNILKLIFSHLNFAVFANPIRYFSLFGVICGLTGFTFMGSAFYCLLNGRISIYYALVGLCLLIVCLLFFGFAVVSHQNNYILRELWRIQKENS